MPPNKVARPTLELVVVLEAAAAKARFDPSYLGSVSHGARIDCTQNRLLTDICNWLSHGWCSRNVHIPAPVSVVVPQASSNVCRAFASSPVVGPTFAPYLAPVLIYSWTDAWPHS